MPIVGFDPVVQAQSNKKADLTAKLAGDLALATMHLFTNDVTPTALTVLADLDEAAYAGYAAQAVAGWGTPEADPQGHVEALATTVLTFTGPAGGSGPVVHGYFCKSAGAGTPLIYAVRFPTPISLADDTQHLDLVPSYFVP